MLQLLNSNILAQVPTQEKFAHIKKLIRNAEINLALSHTDTLLRNKEDLNADELSTLYNLRGVIYKKNAQYEEAIDSYYEALRYQENNDKTLSNLGLVYRHQKNYELALKYLNQSLAIKGKKYGLDSPEITSTYINKGTVFANQQQYDSLMYYFEKALAIRQEHYPEGHPRLVSIYNKIAAASFSQNNYKKAVQYYDLSAKYGSSLKALLTSHRYKAQALWRLDDQKAALQGLLVADSIANLMLRSFKNQEDKLWLVETISDMHERGLDIALATGDLPQAFYFAERNRANVILNELVDTTTRMVTVQEVQKQLDSSTSLIEYAIMKDKLVIFVIQKDQYFVEQINIQRETLNEDIRLILRAVRQSRQKEFLRKSYELYQSLIQPILPHISSTSKLYIIPEGSLLLLPFEMLIPKLPNLNQPPIGINFNLDYLLKDYTIQYNFSSSLAFSPFKPYKGELDFLAVAPTYEGKNFTPLSLEEVNELGSLFTKENKQISLLTDQDISQESLGRQKGGDIVHISAHGYYSRKSRSPSIALQDTSELSYKEIFDLDLKSNLLVLSSCRGGIGQISNGEGVLALNRAFMYAGSQNIIYSLWSVREKPTKELMISFYNYIFAGYSYPSALRRAKIDMINHKKTFMAFPIFWAGFVPLCHSSKM